MVAGATVPAAIPSDSFFNEHPTQGTNKVVVRDVPLLRNPAEKMLRASVREECEHLAGCRWIPGSGRRSLRKIHVSFDL
jgi:hypothetical protein